MESVYVAEDSRLVDEKGTIIGYGLYPEPSIKMDFSYYIVSGTILKSIFEKDIKPLIKGKDVYDLDIPIKITKYNIIRDIDIIQYHSNVKDIKAIEGSEIVELDLILPNKKKIKAEISYEDFTHCVLPYLTEVN